MNRWMISLRNVRKGLVCPLRFPGLGLAFGLLITLAACGGRQTQATGASGASPAELLSTPASVVDWAPWPVPGKRYAAFEPVLLEGQPALRVRADASVSILRQRLEPALSGSGRLRFSWRADALPDEARLQESGRDDAALRVLLAFEGDRSRWSARTHRLSELSRLVTGEALPYATLAYVWSASDAPGTVVMNPRTDRIRKLVLDSGVEHLGQWRTHERDIRADFVRAFGEEPGPLVAVALMTDTDNTGSRLQAWYGPLLLQAGRPVAP